MELYRLCRLCLTHSCYYTNIFVDKFLNKRLHHLINSICEMNVYQNDGLPEFICVDCFQNISRTFSFINQAKEAASALKLMVARNKILGTSSINKDYHNHPDCNEGSERKHYSFPKNSRALSQNAPLADVQFQPIETQALDVKEEESLHITSENSQDASFTSESEVSRENEKPNKENRIVCAEEGMDGISFSLSVEEKVQRTRKVLGAACQETNSAAAEGIAQVGESEKPGNQLQSKRKAGRVLQIANDSRGLEVYSWSQRRREISCDEIFMELQKKHYPFRDHNYSTMHEGTSVKA